jgi:23S rRNA pseudouridine1911/1915/1917 synthase
MKEWILFDDIYICVVNKPATIPTQPDLTGDASLLQLMEQFLGVKLFLIHRLDRVASGIVVFAKDAETAALLSKQFQDKAMEKTYLAIVEKSPPKESDVLIHYLRKNAKTNTSKVFEKEEKDTKRSELHYIIRSKSDRYVLLEVKLLTGRHHQIRAQLNAIGCSIKGDVKYGARRSNENKAIHLHAWQLKIKHPRTLEHLFLKALPPDDVLWNYFKTQISF